MVRVAVQGGNSNELQPHALVSQQFHANITAVRTHVPLPPLVCFSASLENTLYH